MSSASLSTVSAARRTTTAVSSKKVTPMSSLERLQLIRVAVTRIEHALESYRHSSALDPFHQQTAPTFAKIQSYVTNWHPTGHKRSKKQVAAGPTSHREQLQSVTELMSDVKGMISKFPSQSNADDVPYEKLSLHYLQSIEGNLFELTSLLQPLAEVTDQASRKEDATSYLQDAVAHLVSDADMIAQKHLPAYIEECLNEGVCYTAEVQDESAHVRLDRAPLVGIFVVDAAIGISPVRSPRPALSHLQKLIELVETRCKSEVQILTALLEQKNDQNVAEQLSILEQILAAAEAARQQNAALRAEWATKEDKYLREAIRGIDQTLLRQSKSLDALKVLDSVTAIARQIQHIALPFLAPQYCRRRGLSYTSPCSLRLGIRLYDPRSAAFLSLTNINNSTVNNDGMTPIAPDLLPSSDELWLDFDRFPEVVKGERCVLRNATEEDHFRSLEEQREVGGYYVINGGERIIRALMMQRSNVPLNILRDRFAEAGPGFSNKAVVVRSKRPSGITAVNYFYYSTTGEIVFSFARRIVWHIPVSLLLMACKSTSPKELFETLSCGVTDPDQIARIEAFLQCHANKPYASCTDLVEFLAVIGRMYRAYQQNASVIHFIPDLTQKSQPQCDAWYGLFMIRRHLLTHLNVKAPTPDCPVDGVLDPTWPGPLVRAELEAKFHALVHLVRQLYGFVAGASEHQGNDVPSFQEVFGPSQLMIAGLETCIASFCKTAARRLAMNVTGAFFNKFSASPMDASLRLKLRHYVEGACSRSPEALGTLTKLMTTGNFKVDRDEDFFLPQNSGWIVMAEHLNFFRFFEQLRTLHRGKKIAEMRSSEVRKYPSEAFGFLCMVHSPDGEDCGIVNFMSVSTVVTLPTDENAARSNLLQLAEAQFDLVKLSDPLSARVNKIPFLVEGAVLGYLSVRDAERLTDDLRSKKLYRLSDAKTALHGPKSGLYHTEVVLVRPGEKSPEGLFVFTSGCRMMRSVTDLKTGMSLMIGTWEQIWLDIAAVPSDLVDAKRDIGKTYQLIETSGTNIVSLTSNTIPFFEHNCSPRNLFQCGLSKQSCGTQLQSAAWRKEAKLFRVVTPQRYLVRTTTMDEAGLDDFSLGVNAVVAVLAYTGYDMDDAVIVNRSAVERGLLTALITVAKVVDLKSQVNCPPGDVAVFHNLDSTGGFVTPELDARGLPPKRTPYGLTKFDRDHTHPSLVDSSAVYSYALRSTSVDPDTRKPKFTYQKHSVKKWRDFDKGENAWVHHVVPLEYDGPDVTKVLIVFRIPRSPYVGDKFSSRHGQKGTLPLHIKSHDLPFTSRGMTPDVIINPHAFPSRMTLGMMLEMVAGKMSAVQGRYFDNSPWTVVDEDPVSAERVGEALVSNGFARYGRETLYCGNTGAMMDADVFFGVCGYQRLRHMVSDKWQSRARTDHTHKAVTKTGQPVKGRKRHGGVRVGEMERDGLLSHGIAAVVQDRLLHVSDKTKAFICSRCGSLVGIYEKHTSRFQTVKECGYCGEEASGHSGNDNVQLIDIPQVLRLWASELTGVGVRVAFKIEDPFRADH